MADRTAALAAQVDAMARLGFMLGHWRGAGWTMAEHGRVEFEQEEHVRSLLSGEIITVEGRANAPGDRDDVRFTAFAVARYDCDTRAYCWRAYSAGSCVEVPLEVGTDTCSWTLEPGPGVLMRFTTTHGPDTWHEVGHLSLDGATTWRQTFEMTLTKQGSDQPSSTRARSAEASSRS